MQKSRHGTTHFWHRAFKFWTQHSQLTTCKRIDTKESLTLVPQFLGVRRPPSKIASAHLVTEPKMRCNAMQFYCCCNRGAYVVFKKLVVAKSLKRRSWNCLVKRRQRNVIRIMRRRMEFPWLQIAALLLCFFFHIAPYVMMFFVIQSLSPNPLTVHQDYKARHDRPVKKAIGDFQIRLEGNSKRTSGIRVRWGPEKGSRCCFADVTNREKITPATQSR